MSTPMSQAYDLGEITPEREVSPDATMEELMVVEPLSAPAAPPEQIRSNSILGRQSSMTKIDPYDVDQIEDSESEEDSAEWRDLSSPRKAIRYIRLFVKFVLVFVFLYFFVCALDLMSTSFPLIGGSRTRGLLENVELLKNPIVGVMLGLLVTALIHSSSTSTSIMVQMAAAGVISVHDAIPMVMGANVGTSITGSMVAFLQIRDINEFRRAFAGAIIHDIFNWLSVIVMLFTEVLFAPLEKMSAYMVENIRVSAPKGNEFDLIKSLTRPLTSRVIQVNKTVMKAWMTPTADSAKYMNATTMLKDCVSYKQVMFMQPIVTNVTEVSNGSVPYNILDIPVIHNVSELTCNYLLHNTGMSDAYVGAILLVCSVTFLCLSLLGMLRVLHSMLHGHVAKLIRHTINMDIPYIPWATGYVAIAFGTLVTLIIQSSTVFTSTLTPLVGLGVVSVNRMYPLTIGANIGTTATALVASLAVEPSTLYISLQLAIVHVIFNIAGILLFYIIPCTRVPVPLAKMLGNVCSKYRWFAVVFLVATFLIIPLFVFTLSLAGPAVFSLVMTPLMAILGIVTLINILQRKRPDWLPSYLQSWVFLPRWMRSLQPYDDFVTSYICCCQSLKRTREETYRNPVFLAEIEPPVIGAGKNRGTAMSPC
jgi:sodium-dependent phosphate cotransporter